MSTNKLPPAKILIVDDEPSNVRLLERILDLFGGIQYRSTTDPREAVPLFAEFQPDLVLTDLHMPHLDGYQLMEQLRQLVSEDFFLPIVVLTADITAETRRRALAAGASDFITKPLDATEVQLRIRNLLENRFLNLRLEEQVRERTAALEQAMEQLRASQEQAVRQERLRALGEMAGGIAHDFNNSLTMMLGYGELLLPWLVKNGAEAKEQQYLQHILAAAQDATHVVARLRDFSRPTEKGDIRTPVDLSQICQQAVDFTAPRWRGKAQAAGVNIEVKIDCGEVPNVLGSAPELRETLTNLIFNAVDAMPRGGTITIRTRALPDSVCVDVTDTGLGMTEAEKSHCLDPYYSTKGEGGTGLGLSVVYGIIQRHEGTIEIESAPGAGTTFSLLLPITTAQQIASEVAVAATVQRALRILVADDQEMICELISEHLAADGHETFCVFDGNEALKLLMAQRVDLVITDQSMPGLSGEQVGRAVKQLYPGTPVILLTGFGQELQENGALPEGVDMIVAKPISAANLRRAVFEAVRGAGEW